jgi:peroxiredoxin Q/BCP
MGDTALMKKAITAAAASLALLLPMTVHAELPVGAKAPQFSTQVAKAGKQSGFNLSKALARGPVVLYFYPKAFTQGCTLEAHAFAEAQGDFAAEGATILGMSADDIDTLKRFSTEECRDKFAVGVATPAIIKAYDVVLKLPPEYAARASSLSGTATNRTSYVIAPNGRISFVHSDLDYRDHVRLTLEAVKALKAK